MILKFTHNMRIDQDGNVSISSEQVVDSEEEAEKAGAEFMRVLLAFMRGYTGEAPQSDES